MTFDSYWLSETHESFQPCRPIFLFLQTVYILMRWLITNHLIRIYTVCHSLSIFDGCSYFVTMDLQIKRWKSPFQILRVEMVKGPRKKKMFVGGVGVGGAGGGWRGIYKLSRSTARPYNLIRLCYDILILKPFRPRVSDIDSSISECGHIHCWKYTFQSKTNNRMVKR